MPRESRAKPRRRRSGVVARGQQRAGEVLLSQPAQRGEQGVAQNRSHDGGFGHPLQAALVAHQGDIGGGDGFAGARVVVHRGDHVVVAEQAQGGADVDEGVTGRAVVVDAPTAPVQQCRDVRGGGLPLLGADLGPPPAQGVLHVPQRVPRGQPAAVERREQFLRRVDGHAADVDQRPDQSQPADVRLAVFGLVAMGSHTRGQQALAHVVLDRRGSDAAGAAEFGDPHRTPRARSAA